ncbi:MAG: hypothetical protein EOP60_10190 [Sphingomonadales bacterium]|nr:MAG: hypothetical protein EOP60_10190 [Sphingomonadales bacterium]
MSSPGTWDIVVGVCESQVNSLLSQLASEFPGYYHSFFGYSGGAIEAVAFTFLSPPTLSFAASEEYMALARQHLSEIGYGGNIEAGALEMNQAAGVLTCDNLSIILIEQTAAIPVTATLTCSAALQVSPANTLGLTFSDCHVTLSQNPTNDPNLASDISENILAWLYTHIADPFQIPLALPGGTFSSFVVGSDPGADPSLLAYTGYQPVVAPGDPGQWPTGSVFMGFDAAVVNNLANAAIPQLSGTGGISTPNFSWNWGAIVTCDVQLQQSSGSTIATGLNIWGNASITYHAPNGIPNPTIGASISGSCSAVTQLSILAPPGETILRLTLDSLSGFDLKLDLGGCPGFIADLINDCVSPIINDIVSNLTSSVQGDNYDLLTFPPLSINTTPSSNGPSLPAMTLSLSGLTPEILTGPDSINVVGLVGTINLAKN